VQARSFAEMLEQTIRRYQNRAIEAAQVIEELIALAKEVREAHARGEALKLSEDELAFCDALETNDSAVKVLGDETLRTIAQEVVRAVRANVTIKTSTEKDIVERDDFWATTSNKQLNFGFGRRVPRLKVRCAHVSLRRNFVVCSASRHCSPGPAKPLAVSWVGSCPAAAPRWWSPTTCCSKVGMGTCPRNLRAAILCGGAWEEHRLRHPSRAAPGSHPRKRGPCSPLRVAQRDHPPQADA